MAESQLKRLRQEPLEQEYSNLQFGDSGSVSKRLKPLNNILSFLEEDEPEPSHEPSHGLLAIYTTLQRELSPDSSAFENLTSTAEEDSDPPPLHQQTTTGMAISADLDEGVESVMRHLLEASDDELGIPNTGNDKIADVSSDENVPFAFTDHGLLDLEDETTNY